MDPFTAVTLGLRVLETAERVYSARIEAAQKEEAAAIAEHLARTAAAHATIKSISFGEDP